MAEEATDLAKGRMPARGFGMSCLATLGGRSPGVR